ncbi:hypothetical protein SFRURICE_010781 [Spodoptera frugiperda]|nr:hypothetical protein SFRURICE_010781 [Spodoptera frugiperda]
MELRNDSKLELSKVEVGEPRNPKVYFRDVDPFHDYSESCFKKRFRFSKSVVIHVILPRIIDSLQSETRRELPISPLCQLLTALRFCATGSFQVEYKRNTHNFTPFIPERVGRDSVLLPRNFRKSEKSPVILCPTRESNPRPLVWQSHLRPLDQQASQNTKDDFEKLGCIGRASGLKNIVGTIDCTHIKITKPRGIFHTEQYRNKKRYFSLNVQANIPGTFPDSVLTEIFFEKPKKPSYTSPDPGIELETPCPAVALATTEPTRQPEQC